MCCYRRSGYYRIQPEVLVRELPYLRESICEGLEYLGIKLDSKNNNTNAENHLREKKYLYGAGDSHQ